MRLSTGNSPRKLEPQDALQPMPASVMPISWAWAMMAGQRSISSIWLRLVLRRANTSHKMARQTGVSVALDGERRRVSAGALDTTSVERQRGVGDAELGA